MNAMGVVRVSLFVTFVVLAVMTYRRSGRARRPRELSGPREPRGITGETIAVHYPLDDPLWREHSKRQSTRNNARKEKRRKIWAAGTAGAVGAGYTDPGGGCGAGCGGGGCGGGCGGG
ncbi:MAG: hypothetical protein QOD39_4992 [Mycobacterium sp.]|jgi:hypothetical protein|nr:hypothetical protein [Mycobacterium sp.]